MDYSDWKTLEHYQKKYLRNKTLSPEQTDRVTKVMRKNLRNAATWFLMRVNNRFSIQGIYPVLEDDLDERLTFFVTRVTLSSTERDMWDIILKQGQCYHHPYDEQLNTELAGVTGTDDDLNAIIAQAFWFTEQLYRRHILLELELDQMDPKAMLRTLEQTNGDTLEEKLENYAEYCRKTGRNVWAPYKDFIKRSTLESAMKTLATPSEKSSYGNCIDILNLYGNIAPADLCCSLHDLVATGRCDVPHRDGTPKQSYLKNLNRVADYLKDSFCPGEDSYAKLTPDSIKVRGK